MIESPEKHDSAPSCRPSGGSPKPLLTIEVLGVVSANKGADLMLEAIRSWAFSLPVECRLAVRWQTPCQRRKHYGLWTKVWHGKGCPVPYGRFMNCVPRCVVEHFGAVRDKDINLVLDASGFAYGDHSGLKGANARTGSRISAWKRQGTKVILLPQAFGPFSSPGLIGGMKHILEFADMVYARDAQSFNFLRQIHPEGDNLQQCPDITSLVDGKEFREAERVKGFVGIIPNYKTFTETESTTREDYLSFLVEVVNRLHMAGKGVVLILHEGLEDEGICEEVRRSSKKVPEYIKREDPLEVKHAIGQCGAVLTSRFHGLASALFQGVPAVSTSWSHKYEQLAGEFGFSDFVLSGLDAEVAVRHLLSFYDPGIRTKLSDLLLQHAGRKREAVAGMWRRVEDIILPGIEARESVKDQ